MATPATNIGDALRRECGLDPFEISFVFRRQRGIADVAGAWIPYGTLAAACGLITAHHLRRALLRQLRMLPQRARPRALRAMLFAGVTAWVQRRQPLRSIAPPWTPADLACAIV